MLSRNEASYSTLDDPEDPELVSRARRGRVGNRGELIDLRGLWLVLRWRASLIGLFALATAVVAGVALFVLPPKYKATTIVLVDPRQPRVTQAEAVLSGIGTDAAAVESQVELIESSALARRVIARLSLDTDPDFNTPSALERITGGLLALLVLQSADLPDEKISRLVNKFQKGLSVRRRGLTYVLEISYLAGDPAKAARLSGAVAEAYLEDQRQAKADITARASGWLIDRIEEMRDRVRSSEQAVAAYKSANSIVDVTQGNRLVARQVEDLTQQLALQRSRTADARARLERIQQGANRISDPAALSESLQSAVIANLRTQYTEAARLEAEYSALYGSKFPGLVAIRAQRADVRKQIEAEIARILIAVRNEYQVATSHEASLEAELVKLKDQSGQNNETNVKLHELEREAQANRTLFEQFLNRAKETTEQQSLQIADARIISPALIPLRPDRPPTILLVMAATLCGAMLGIGLVLALERMRRGFRTADELERALSIPTLGILACSEAVAKGSNAAAPRIPPKIERNRFLSPRFDDVAAAAEANLRAIRARLRRAGSGQASESLIILSALPGEGKSTFARNYARASAHGGVRTLLIDADIYTCSATRAFGMSGAGLCEVLDGEATLFSAMRKESRSGLHILGARSEATSPAQPEEMDGKGLEPLLHECRKHFDLIVIDSPAVLPIGGLVPFVKCADRALLIVEWERTDRQAVAEVVNLLGEDAEKIAGTVLNKVAAQWYRFFDGGRYLNAYGYGLPATVPAAAAPDALAIKKAS
jgi:succinoglycan biosynthesis transport protein ExoP